jgi:hypothetical protein
VKITAKNIKDLFQIYFCTSRRLLLKIFLWTTNIFDANIFMEGIFEANIFMKNIFCLYKIVAENIIIVSWNCLARARKAHSESWLYKGRLKSL